MKKVRAEKVKVTVNLPRELVRAAKIRAIEQSDQLQRMIERGLRTELQVGPPR